MSPHFALFLILLILVAAVIGLAVIIGFILIYAASIVRKKEIDGDRKEILSALPGCEERSCQAESCEAFASEWAKTENLPGLCPYLTEEALDRISERMRTRRQTLRDRSEKKQKKTAFSRKKEGPFEE